MAKVATAGTALAMIIGVNEKECGDSTGIVHSLHIVREGEARGDGDGQVDDSIEGILEKAVIISKGPRDPAELEEMVPHHLSREALWDARDPHGGDRGPRGPYINQGILRGRPGDAGDVAGECLEEGRGDKGDPPQEG